MSSIAKLSLSFSFSLTELVIVSANTATRHPDKYKFLNLNMKSKVVYIDLMNSNCKNPGRQVLLNLVPKCVVLKYLSAAK